MPKSTLQKNVSIIHQASGQLKVLADATRLNLLLSLAEGPKDVMSLSRELGLAQPAISHHLGLLRMNGLCRNTRDGKRVIYALSDSVSRTRDGVCIAAGLNIQLGYPAAA